MFQIRRIAAALFACGLIALAAPAATGQDLVPNQIVLRLNPGENIADVNATFGTSVIDVFEEDDGFDVLYLLDATGLGDEAVLAAMMAADPRVFEAEPNFLQDTPEGVRHMVVIAIGGTQSDYEDQGITDRIDLPQAHAITRGLGSTVAVLDTGIDTDHPVFSGRILGGGYDFVDDDDVPEDESDGLDGDGDGFFDDGYGHGTMVSSIITLVAPEANLLPIRVLDDEGRGDVFSIIRGVRLARERGVRVINMSFGSPFNISILQTELGRAEDEGIAIVAGAGNEGIEQEYFPGGSSKVLMVTALDSLDRKADFADYSDEVAVAAPGTGVRGAFPGGGWALGDGCSFAAPFLAGELALIRAIAPSMNLEVLENRVLAAVDPIYGIPGNGPYVGQLGSGRINVHKALLGLQTSSVDGPGLNPGAIRVFPNPTPAMVTFGVPAGLEIESISIYDARGRLVHALAGAPGGTPVWSGRRTDGRPAETGVYFYRVQSTQGALHTGSFVLKRP